MMDSIFPNIQFVITVGKRGASAFPAGLSRKHIPYIDKAVRLRKKGIRKPNRGSILLIQVDGTLPNLALMKLSRHHKGQGRKVALIRGSDNFKVKGAEAVFASCVFNFPASLNRVAALKEYYGDSLVLGGSGVNIGKRLPDEIERLPADYSLYPELKDRAIGFITRGCPSRCAFCIVPEKEGIIRKVSPIGSLIEDNRSKLILLDDNILAHPEAADLLEEMAERKLQVNFTQTLDIHRVSEKTAPILRRIHCTNTKFTRNTYYFSCNDNKRLDALAARYRLLDFGRNDNVEFVCMYGYNTSLAQDVERFRFLRSLPGAYVFVQQYRPALNGPEPDLDGFFDGDTDRLIDELVGILFPQNMKSMENYYRWLSKRYAETFGRLHTRLVDTIFRYNHRHRKGNYIATLAGTRKRHEDIP